MGLTSLGFRLGGPLTSEVPGGASSWNALGGCELPGSLGVALGVTLKVFVGLWAPVFPSVNGVLSISFSLGWEVMSSLYGKAAEEYAGLWAGAIYFMAFLLPVASSAHYSLTHLSRMLGAGFTSLQIRHWVLILLRPPSGQ